VGLNLLIFQFSLFCITRGELEEVLNLLAVFLTNFNHFLFALSVTTQVAIKIHFFHFKNSELSHLSV
jgi:hypothetical protein